MHDIILRIKYKKRQYPTLQKKEETLVLNKKVVTKWNELTQAQLLEIIRIQFNFEPGHLQNLHLLKVLLQVEWAHLHLFTAVQRLSLYPLLSFLQENSLTKQLLPSIEPVAGTVLYGPDERFRNLTFAEFIYTETLYTRLAKKLDEETLDRLIAVLYRPQRQNYNPASPNYKGDIREDFNEHLFAGREPLIRQLPMHYKLAILAWYRGCKKELEALYDKVFTEGNQQKASRSDWGDVVLSLSGGKFGTLEQTATQRVHTIFKEMQRLAREHEEIEKRHKRTQS
ncbi:hypothetical protein [Pontibacter litorisediminis]|uniref:hypothetical protein n=1 Tax=Pontibacter litorisediminis TaxID=1846260 RepID=UPI0023EC699B|nr:hypothetical protein [Pontibacter litorisediminis]